MAARLTTFIVVAIVAGTLIAGLIVGATRDDSDGPIDLIIHHARVYTATPEGTMAEAVAIRGSQILRVGSDREIMRLARPQTTMIDAKGAAVVPGFNDAHLDLAAGGAALDRIDLLDAPTADEVLRRIQDGAEASPDRPWVLGRGWRRDTFGASPPTRQMLDRIVPDRPAEILSADGTEAWVNSKALAAAGISRRTPNPAHGAIVRDARTGEATGLLDDAAVSIVGRLVPAPTSAEQDRALRGVVAEAHRYGITSVQDVNSSLGSLAAYANARRAGDLKLRIYAAVPVTGDVADATLDRLRSSLSEYPDDPLLKGGAVNVTLDRSADAGRPGGSSGMSDDALNRLVRRLDAQGWQVLTEAQSARAVEMALTAYDHAVRSNPQRTAERRHRLEGPGTLEDVDLARLDPLNLLATLRPAVQHAIPEGESGENEDDAAPALARRIVSARGHVAFGSGWPAASLNPLIGLSAAITPAAGGDGARLTLKSALDAYTSSSAWASFDEQRKGTLAPGMLADLVVLSDDIFKLAPADIATTRVELTIFDGKVVYRRGQRDTN